MKTQEDRTDTINDEKQNKGTLYIVSTPIGNDEDITLRALRVLKMSDFVVCEEGKIGARMLHKLNLNVKMELLNEQNEIEKTGELLNLLNEGKTLSIVSDAGTPVFADPGLNLVRSAIEKGIKVIVVPGASSIMTAIVRSGFSIDQFVYAGFLSRDNKVRLQQLKGLKNETKTIVLLETPYRLMPLLKAGSDIMPDRKAYIGCNLTMPYESHHYGTFTDLLNKFSEMKFKGEFVICFEGSTGYEPEEKTDLQEDHYPSDRPERRFERPFNRERSRSTFDRDIRSNDNRSSGGFRTGQRDRQDNKDYPKRDFKRRDDSEFPKREYKRRDDSEFPKREYKRRDDSEFPKREYKRRDDSAFPKRDYKKRDDREYPKRDFNKQDKPFREKSDRKWDNERKGTGRSDFKDSKNRSSHGSGSRFGKKPFGKPFGKGKGKPKRNDSRD